MLYHIGIIISVCLCIRGTYVCFCLRIYGRRLHIFVPTRLSMVVFTNAHSVDRAFLCCILQLCWATLNYSFWAGVKYSRSISFLKKASTWKKTSITITINEIRTVLYTKFHSQSQPVVWFSGIFERCRLLEPPPPVNNIKMLSRWWNRLWRDSKPGNMVRNRLWTNKLCWSCWL